MIDREPLKRGANEGRRPDKRCGATLGADYNRVPIIARLSAALERRIVGIDELAYGRCRVRSVCIGALGHASGERYEHA